MRICVVGTGYVGLVTGACFAEFGNSVTCVDRDVGKIDALRAGQIPIHEPGLEDLVQRNVKAGRLGFATELGPAIEDALVVFIAVGTPGDEAGRADLTFVHEVARAVGRHLKAYKVVVTKSTVPAGTGKVVREIIAEELREPHAFSVAANPEFLREGSALEDFMRPNRIVIGADDEMAAAILRDLYRPLYLIETPLVLTDVVSAEMIKYASNAFLATKISFINEVADLCEAVGADVHVVAKGMGLDRRIGSKFLHPGLGFGGSCFPKDTRGVLELARDHDIDLRIVRATIEVNAARVARMAEKVRLAVGGELAGRTLGLLGLTFKPNTDDLRESPAMELLRRLVAAGAHVRAYDPVGMAKAQVSGPPGVAYVADEYAAAAGAEALIIATEWNQFRGLDLDRLRGLLSRPLVIDLRNVYDPRTMRERGFEYCGVGR